MGAPRVQARDFTSMDDKALELISAPHPEIRRVIAVSRGTAPLFGE
jgi:hypothetical protein